MGEKDDILWNRVLNHQAALKILNEQLLELKEEVDQLKKKGVMSHNINENSESLQCLPGSYGAAPDHIQKTTSSGE